MQQSTLDKKLPSWIYEATEDVLGLWQLCRSARYEWKAKTPEEVKRLVLGFVRALLQHGLEAVDVQNQQPWKNQDPDSVVERISREWDDLGREPNVPDIVWFKKKR